MNYKHREEAKHMSQCVYLLILSLATGCKNCVWPLLVFVVLHTSFTGSGWLGAVFKKQLLERKCTKHKTGQCCEAADSSIFSLKNIVLHAIVIPLGFASGRNEISVNHPATKLPLYLKNFQDDSSIFSPCWYQNERFSRIPLARLLGVLLAIVLSY